LEIVGFLADNFPTPIYPRTSNPMLGIGKIRQTEMTKRNPDSTNLKVYPEVYPFKEMVGSEIKKAGLSSGRFLENQRHSRIKVHPPGVEPGTNGLENRCSIH
jgi:hypothetical protein